VVRPSHTYDDASPPLPGGRTVVDRIACGEEIPVGRRHRTQRDLRHHDDPYLRTGLLPRADLPPRGVADSPMAIVGAYHAARDVFAAWGAS
jgi:hypothetical protein